MRFELEVFMVVRGVGRNDLPLERTGGRTDRGKPPVLLLSVHPHLDLRRHVHRPDP